MAAAIVARGYGARDPVGSRTMEACEETAGALCRVVLDLGGDPSLARTLDVLLGRPITAVLIVLLAIVAHGIGARAIRRVVRRYESEVKQRIERAAELGTAAGSPRAETRRLQRLHAISGAARSALGLVVGTTALLLVLAQFVDLRPVLAGAGLAGIVLGFGAQSMIADLLAGFSMLVEDQYGVGDWIDVDGKVGEVEHVGLRATSFRDIDGTVWHVPNGHVTKVGNLSQRWARATLEIPLPLDVDLVHARRVVTSVAHGLLEDPRWADDIIAEPEIWGITGWSADGLTLRLVVPTRPLRNWDVNRQLRERLKIAFDREGIRMPVPMREHAGSPTRTPVNVHSTERTEPRDSDVPPFDPSVTDRLGAETDWPQLDPAVVDARPVRPARPD